MKLFLSISDEVAKKLERYCKDNRMPKSALIENLLKEFFEKGSTKDDIRSITWSKPLPLRFGGICVKCGRRIEAGELALLSRSTEGWKFLCYDCYLKINEKASEDVKKIYKYYKELRKVKNLLNYARAELDEVVDKINLYELYDKLDKLDEELYTTIRSLYDYLEKVESNVDLKKILEKIEEIREELLKISEFMTYFLKKRRKKKVIEV